MNWKSPPGGVPEATRPLRWHSIYQPECQFDQSYNDDCAEDNELSENILWSVDRANFDYWAPRAYRNVNDVGGPGFFPGAAGRWPFPMTTLPPNRDQSRADESVVLDTRGLCDLAHRA